jgi:hypothetical protein
MKALNILVTLAFVVGTIGIVCGQVDYYVEPDEEQSMEQVQEQPDRPQQQAQVEQEGEGMSLRDRIYVGGGFGAAFGDNAFVNLSPIIGYRITPKLSSGLRLTYQYRSFKDFYSGKRYNSNDFGIGVFARMMLFGPVFAQAEYEYLNYEYFTSIDTKERLGFNSFMLGGGIIQPIGKRAAFFVTALYNFSYRNDSTEPQPYGNPLILRVGFTGGF